VSRLRQLHRLLEHAVWADAEILAGLAVAIAAPPQALREFAHIIGVEEVWLARLERRTSRAAVWPTITLDETRDLSGEVHRGYAAFLSSLRDDDLDLPVEYTNSAGKDFSTPIGDILLHVSLHGQYHRGKVNLMLRENGQTPAPTDYIAFVRGVPAAIEPSAAG
jgi:uncharacterized damage-inducible protein DinB